MSSIKILSQYPMVTSIGPTDTLIGNVAYEGQLPSTSRVEVTTLTNYLTSKFIEGGIPLQISDSTKLSLSGGILTGLLQGVDATFERINGSFYGDGSNLTGTRDSTKLPLSGGIIAGFLEGVEASFTSLSGTFYGNGSNLTGVLGTDSSKLPLSGGILTGDLSGTNITADKIFTAQGISFDPSQNNQIGYTGTELSIIAGNALEIQTSNTADPDYNLLSFWQFLNNGQLVLPFDKNARTSFIVNSFPAEGDYFLLTTPDGISHKFEYDYDGDSIAEFPIQIRPLINNTLHGVAESTYSAVTASELFHISYNEQFPELFWIYQKVTGVSGNQLNQVAGGSITLGSFWGGAGGIQFGDGTTQTTAFTGIPANSVFRSVSAASLSGTFFGDGSNLTGIGGTANALPLSGGTLTGSLSGTTAVFSDSVLAASLSGVHFGDGSNLTGINDSTKLALSGGQVTGNLTVTGSISASGITYFTNTVFSTTSALSVVNNGLGPALYVQQGIGSGDIASFYDADGIEALHVGNAKNTSGQDPSGVIGINTSFPNKTLTVVGEISATSDITASGAYYGDGGYLTNINAGNITQGTLSTERLPATVTITDSVSAPALSGTFYGDGSKLTGIVQLSAATFSSDLIVSLPGGKTFGRYNSGDVIPATGKTPAEVIQMAISAPINPTVSLTTSTTVAFNQTNINNVLNFSHVVNTLGATVSSSSLEWRRNGSGNWTQLSTATNSSYTHTLTDTNFNTAPFNYRYTITDTAGASAVATVNITPASYSAPTISIAVVGQTVTSPETNSTRERGNITSVLSGSITKNSANTTLQSYVVQFSINGGSYTNIGTPTSITGNSNSFSGVIHTPTGATTSASYRIAVTDDFTTSNGAASTVNFYYLVFYGPSSSEPTDSNSVRSLPSKGFTNSLSNPFTLNTGTTQTKFTVAMPTPTAVTLVQDLDASNATLTNNYINNPFNVNDGGGNAVSYNIYTLSIATPYSSSHRHQITRA